MTKSYEELATELTIAWIEAVGKACASETNKFGSSWLKHENVLDMYKKTLETMVSSYEEIKKK